ncbi:MAG: hypothetical protein BroJett022_00820 [Actinomycetes bacterium]|nr:MAG: hypothetical protein BroJett022_00820 [Actinomycetes bacterium]
MRFYEREWWTRGRERADVERMLAGSDVVISAVTEEGGELAGFVRAITDGVYRGVLFDLIVAPPHRGRGLGGELVRRVHEHPAMAGCGRVELICIESMVPFYERLGYAPAPAERLRMIWRRPAS